MLLKRVSLKEQLLCTAVISCIFSKAGTIFKNIGSLLYPLSGFYYKELILSKGNAGECLRFLFVFPYSAAGYKNVIFAVTVV